MSGRSAGLCHLDAILARCDGAYSPITLRGYRNDLLVFMSWCVRSGQNWLPASPASVARFIDEETNSKSIATIRRRVCAIQFAHRISDLPSPLRHSDVFLALRRATRAKRRRPRQALGLTAGMLERIAAACPDTLLGARDAALFSVGYDTLCRSAELAAIHVEHVSADLGSLVVPRSKSDPFGDGRVAFLSAASAARLRRWLDLTGIAQGPLFRGLHTGTLSPTSLDTSSIRRRIKVVARRAGLSPDQVSHLSGHSMRVGAAQDMLVAGVDALGIMQAGGWRSHAVLARYVEYAAAGEMHHRRWAKLQGQRSRSSCYHPEIA
ncbi:tyrosine-type recombinase/integrase [Tsuneonella sp. SYSU-LHT278]|uniref:tyrosine-type recombinase/integrase n=1 Tax=Tsuneonella sediminis TaxID=3416089 RepID=UPI003F7AEADA